MMCGPRVKDYRLRLLLAGFPEEKISYTEDELDTPDKLKLNGEAIYMSLRNRFDRWGKRWQQSQEDHRGKRGKQQMKIEVLFPEICNLYGELKI